MQKKSLPDFKSLESSYESLKNIERDNQKSFRCYSLIIGGFYVLGFLVGSIWFGWSSVLNSVGIPLTTVFSLVYFFVQNDDASEGKMELYEGLKKSVGDEYVTAKNKNRKLPTKIFYRIIRKALLSDLTRKTEE